MIEKIKKILNLYKIFGYLPYKLPTDIIKRGDVHFEIYGHTPKIKVGKGTYGHIKVINYGIKNSGDIEIGNYSSISDITIILGGGHQFGISTYPFRGKFFGEIEKHTQPRQKISIGNDVWIGYDVLILDSVKIEDGAIIGARALVTKDIAQFGIAVGIPAKIIRYRFDDVSIKKIKRTNWWNLDKSELIKYVDIFYSTDVKKLVKNLKDPHDKV